MDIDVTQSSGVAVVAPHGGVKRVLGTNPYAWATPGPDGCNLVLDFSTAVTGSLFFVPTADFLAHPPSAPRPTNPPSGTDQSLGIGSLRDAGLSERHPSEPRRLRDR